jgi:hypothetical protein
MVHIPFFWLLYDDQLVVQSAMAAIFLAPVLAAIAPRIRRSQPAPVLRAFRD